MKKRGTKMDKKDFLKKLKEIEKKEAKLLNKGDFYFSEFVSSELNELQNKKVKLMKQYYKEIYLYKINEGKIKKYKSELIRNFEYDFAINKRVKEIEQLFKQLKKERNLKKIYELIDKIIDKAVEYKAVFLHFS